MPETDETPPEEKKPETAPETPQKAERVPEYVERHELKSMLDELRQSFTERTSKDDQHFAALEASIMDMRPKPETKKEAEHDQTEEKPKERKPRYIIFNPFDKRG